MIESLAPEFPWFADWWVRQHIAVRVMLAPFLAIAMTILIVVMFVSIFTWLPIVALLAEIIDA